MRRSSGANLRMLTLLALLTAFAGTPFVSAQSGPAGQPESPPPKVDAAGAAPSTTGAVVLEDRLTGPGATTASECATHRNARVFVGEGLLFKVTGKCTDTSTIASVNQYVNGLTLPDGEVRVELKAVSGHERARFRLSVRSDDQGSNRYYVAFEPGNGSAQLIRSANNEETVLAERTDLAGVAAATDWNALAVRLQGPNLWVLLNDQPILNATDSTYDMGQVILALVRLGNLEDAQESAVVFRNLRVSGLDNSDQARVPTYVPPAAAAPAPSGEPWVGDIRFGYDPSGQDAVPAGSNLKIREGSLYSFFAWRNLPAGAALKVELLVDNAGHGAQEFTPGNPSSGRVRFGLLNFLGGAEGGGQYTLTSVAIVISSGGRELARGSLGLSQQG
jgi:hypothetical protein